MKTYRGVITMALLLSMGPIAEAAEVQVGTVKDNTLYEDPGGAFSNGAGQYFFVGRTGALNNKIRRGLLQFDIAASVPAGATIDSVFLTLFMSKGLGGSQPVDLHRALADWGEGTSDAAGEEGAGGPSATGDATWIHRFFNTLNWTNPGGDFDPTVSAAQAVSLTGPYDWGSTSAMVADVQGWLDTPASNFGWLITGNEVTISSAQRFNTKEDTLPERHPALRVVYTVPSVCSCPSQSDSNGDGFIDSTDLALEIDVIFFGGTDPQDPDCPTGRGDFNADGFADSTDLALLIDHIFFGGPLPSDPCQS